MDTTYPAATFTATRDELLGAEPLLASAEIARGVCRSAQRTVSVLAVMPTRMRRIDGWFGDVEFVTHAAAPDQGRPLLGSVCDREGSPALLRRIIGSLVGGLPDRPAREPRELPPLRGLSPASLPDQVDWVVVVSSASVHGDSAMLMFVGADGLLEGEVTALDRPSRLVPADSAQLDARLAQAGGSAPRSIRDLLSDD